jgi:hypothetical protein
MKEYVLRIGYNPLTDEVEYIKEYIDNCKAVLHIDNETIELEDDLVDCIESDIVGIT